MFFVLALGLALLIYVVVDDLVVGVVVVVVVLLIIVGVRSILGALGRTAEHEPTRFLNMY